MNNHDLRLVVLAGLICALASFSAFTLAHHVRRSRALPRLAWLAITALAAGAGIWATHFVAMLAFAPGVPSGYHAALTGISLLLAIGATGIGFAVAVLTRLPGARVLGGFVVGAGIAVMHFVGMSAFEVAGRISWATGFVIGSVAFGEVFGAMALVVGLRDDDLLTRLKGAALLTVAICVLHFTAMTAVSIRPDPTVDVPSTALPPVWIALGVAFGSVVIISLALAGLALDARDQRRSEKEVARMRGLANAAVEGLLVCNHGHVVTANDSFALLVGTDVERIAGSRLAIYLPEAATDAPLPQTAIPPVASVLHAADGSAIPVEIIRRTIDFSGHPHTAIAVRDLRPRRRAEAERRSALDHLADRFERTILNVTAALAESAVRLGQSAADMNEIIEQSGRSAGAASLAARENTHVAATVSSAIEELSSSMQEIDAQLTRAVMAVDEATRRAEIAVGNADGLATTVGEIDAVASIIQTIASQTNLLSLNATIEAARAGEAGRGFAVVAQEVKLLATQTTQALTAIKDRTGSVGATVEHMRMATQSISEVIGQIDTVSQAIAGSVRLQSEATHRIAESVEGAASRSRQMSDSIEGVNDIASRSHTGAQQITQAVAVLNRLAASLQEEARAFVTHVRTA